jgi:hypothetical protein
LSAVRTTAGPDEVREPGPSQIIELLSPDNASGFPGDGPVDHHHFHCSCSDRGYRDGRARYGYDRRTLNRTSMTAEQIAGPDSIQFRIPVFQKTKPGIDAVLVLTARKWNV